MAVSCGKDLSSRPDRRRHSRKYTCSASVNAEKYPAGTIKLRNILLRFFYDPPGMMQVVKPRDFRNILCDRKKSGRKGRISFVSRHMKRIDILFIIV